MKTLLLILSYIFSLYSIFSLLYAAEIDNNILFAYAEFNTTTTTSNQFETYDINVSNIPVKNIAIGDIDIAYKIFGKGEYPLVLISGSTNVMEAWPTYFLNEMALTHKVIIFDNRGVGNTTIGTHPFTVQQFANDTAKLLDALKIERANVLGFSMGSFVAQQFTLNHPEKVNKLVLYGSSCGGKNATPQVLKL